MKNAFLLYTLSSSLILACGPKENESNLRANQSSGTATEYLVKLSKKSKERSLSELNLVRNLLQQNGDGPIKPLSEGSGVFMVRSDDKNIQNIRDELKDAIIEPNHMAYTTSLGRQPNAPWGLDRIDSKGLDNQYTFSETGQNVHVYVVDTGIRSSHSEFAGRVGQGRNFTSANQADTDDCTGHGTHVAGTILGSIYGVAKQATVHPIRVLGCSGSGSYSSIIDALNWIKANAQKPAVVNMSLGGSQSQILNSAVNELVQSGIPVIVSAGNDRRDSCNASPASAELAITVGATNKTDQLASFSNYGQCVDILAPGNNIVSAGYQGDNAATTLSGTSMAAPHVAGVVAQMLARDPGSPFETIKSSIISNAKNNQISGLPQGTPNKLLESPM